MWRPIDILRYFMGAEQSKKAFFTQNMRRRVNLSWALLTILVIITISATVLFQKRRSSYSEKTTTGTSIEPISVPLVNHVTKSLAELGSMNERNSHILFLNRVPKCGSEVLVLLLQWLQGWNSFRHVRLKGGSKRKLNLVQQEKLVYEVGNVIKNHAVPLSFDRQVYFVNFTLFDRQSPTFINIIRDPVDKLLLRNSHGRTTNKLEIQYVAKTLEECLKIKNKECTLVNGKPYDLSIPYFCGQDPRCLFFNDEWALQRAKLNVNRYYEVVGILEELNSTLEVLENKVPYFFKGVQQLYHHNMLGSQKNQKLIPQLIGSQYARAQLTTLLATEYEFYEWAKERLFRQLQIIYGDHQHVH